MDYAGARPCAIGLLVCGVLGSMAAAPSHAAETDSTSSRAALIRYLDGQATQLLDARRQVVAAIATPAAADARKAAVRAKLLALIGAPVHGVPLAAKVTGTSQGDGYRVENVLYDAQPGRHVTANLFFPTSGKGPFPAVILSPGHGPNGKLSDYGFAANFARNGFVALSYDIVDEGERLEYFDAQTGKSRGERPTGDHSLAAYPAMLTGEHVARYFIEDAMQGVDYLASLPEVDAKRIGAFGCSGGGTVTAYLAALDERVQAAASACYVNDFEHLLASVGPQDGEQSIPDFIADGFDIPDWIELAAPKPYAVISTTEDMFPFAGARAAVEEIRHFWGAYGAADRVDWFYGPGKHGAIAPMGGQIVDFFRRALKPEGAAMPFLALKPARDQDAWVTSTGQLSTSLGSVTLADLERERVKAIAPAKKPDAAALRTAIRRLARVQALPGGKLPETQVSSVTHDGLTVATVIFQSAMGPLEMQVFGAAGKKARRVLLVLDPAPLEQLTRSCDCLAGLVAEGWTAVALQARGADGHEDVKSAIVGDQNLLALRTLMLGRTLPGIRIDDTIHAIDWITQNLPGASITLAGVGSMGPIALQTALLDLRVSVVNIEYSPISWRAAVDVPIARNLPANTIPGVLAAYDLPDVIAAMAPRPVAGFALIDPMGLPLDEDVLGKLVRAPAIAPPVFLPPPEVPPPPPPPPVVVY